MWYKQQMLEMLQATASYIPAKEFHIKMLKQTLYVDK